jgi:hypothetical protein
MKTEELAGINIYIGELYLTSYVLGQQINNYCKVNKILIKFSPIISVTIIENLGAKTVYVGTQFSYIYNLK